jgi:hypothetical protein
MKLPEGKSIAMPRSLLNSWLHALDTEMYPKAGGSMKNANGYCCLGVLQMVACGNVEMSDPVTFLGYPSEEWKAQYNVHFKNPMRSNVSPRLPVLDADLSDLNDMRTGFMEAYTFTFPQIADFIRLHSVALEDLAND